MSLEIREVKKNEALSKQQISRILARENDLPVQTVDKLLSDLGDLFIREVLTTGAWNLKPFPVVERFVLEGRNARNPKTGELEYRPKTCYLSTKIPPSLKKEHQGIFKMLNNQETE